MTRRVLFCGAWDEGPGYPRARALREGLLANGVLVAECRVEGPGRDKQRLLRQPWRWPAWLFGEWRRRRALRRRLAEAETRHRPDVVLVPYPGHLVAAQIRRHSAAPVVLDLFLSAYDTAVLDRALVPPGSLRARLLRGLDRAACRAADLVLLDTEENADFVARLTGLPRERFAAIAVGDPRAPAAAPPYAPPAPGDLRVLFFGTGVPLHGLPVLIEAVASAAGVRLTLVGGTAGERELARRRLGDRLELLPEFVDRDELERLLTAAPLVAGVFGATDKAQRVVPFKVVHALAFGRPAITADTPAVRRVLREGHGGFLVPAADPAALARTLEALAADPQRLAAAAAHAREVHDRHFAVARTGAQLLERIDRLVAGRADAVLASHAAGGRA